MNRTTETVDGIPQDRLLPLHGNRVSYVAAVVGGRYLTQRYWGRRSDALDALTTVPIGAAPWYRDQATGVRYDAGLLHSRGLELDPPRHDWAAQHWILERQER